MERKKNPQNVIAAACRKLRLRNGWTQNQVAARCQLMGWILSRATLAKIESGFRHVNDAEVALLARVFNCTADELLRQSLGRLLQTARHSPDFEEDGDLPFSPNAEEASEEGGSVTEQEE